MSIHERSVGTDSLITGSERKRWKRGGSEAVNGGCEWMRGDSEATDRGARRGSGAANGNGGEVIANGGGADRGGVNRMHPGVMTGDG